MSFCIERSGCLFFKCHFKSGILIKIDEIARQDMYPVQPWLAKASKMAQPDLDFIAPEIQLQKSKVAVPACDAFSLGLLICSIYNGGRSLIQAQYNPACYIKELGRVTTAQLSSIVIGVGAQSQSTWRGDIFARNYVYEKLKK